MKKINLFLLIIVLIAFGVITLQWIRIDYLACRVESEKAILKKYPEYSFVRNHDNQFSDWYFYAQSATSTQKYNLLVKVSCEPYFMGDFNPQVQLLEIDNLNK